jgi:hypothetical protein
MTTKTLIAAATLLATAGAAQAAIDVSTVGFTYNQNFDSLTTSTTAVAWANDSTLSGWSLFISTLADAPTIVAGTGSGTAGSFMSYGASGSGERALGSLASGGAYFGSPASGAVAGYIAVAFVNNTGTTIDGIGLAWEGEQWRNGGNTNQQSLAFSYGVGGAFGTVSWVNTALSISSVVATSTAGAVDGNTTGLTTTASAIAGLGWAPGTTLWLRWADTNDVGNDHGLAIDNFAMSVTAVPEPGALALMLAGLGAVGFIARRRSA